MKKRDLRIERKKHRIDENKDFILDAAEAVFAQKGYRNATMDDIAREAQFSKATLYRYFQSKRDIFFQIILNSFKDAETRTKKIRMKQESSSKKLREIIVSVLQYYHRKKNISRILLMEKSFMTSMLDLAPEDKRKLSRQEKKFLEEVKARKRAIMETTCAIIEEGMEKGEFRKTDPLQACYAFEAMMHGFYLTRLGFEKTYSLERGAGVIHDFFIHGIKK